MKISKTNSSEEDHNHDQRLALANFLRSLPTLNVGQKHSVEIECDLSKEEHLLLGFYRLLWVRLSTPTGDSMGAQANDVKPISLNERMINKNSRFKVTRHPTMQWYLSISNVSAADDDQAYFLCQLSGLDLSKLESSSRLQRFGGYFAGAKLNVLVPPKIVDDETSASLVQANEYEPLSLRCKVLSEPESQLTWKREDGASLDSIQRRDFKELKRAPETNKILSVHSSELSFPSISREQAGAYLCIASNGVQPGVSQRISVRVVNCRSSREASARAELCQPEAALEANQSSGSARPPANPADQAHPRQQAANQVRKNWNLAGTRRGQKQRLQAPGNGDNRARQAEPSVLASRQQPGQKSQAAPAKEANSSKGAAKGAHSVITLSLLLSSTLLAIVVGRQRCQFHH